MKPDRLTFLFIFLEKLLAGAVSVGFRDCSQEVAALGFQNYSGFRCSSDVIHGLRVTETAADVTHATFFHPYPAAQLQRLAAG
eukprot:s1079_g3.t1